MLDEREKKLSQKMKSGERVRVKWKGEGGGLKSEKTECESNGGKKSEPERG